MSYYILSMYNLRLLPSPTRLRNARHLIKSSIVFLSALFFTANILMATPNGGSPESPSAPPITGTVTDEAGTPLASVTVQIAGTAKATVTDNKGNFSINANSGDILQFSIVGYETRSITIGTDKELRVTLTRNQKTLNEVVITALGIKRPAQSLSYATQQVSSESLNTVKTDNLMNALSGKVAGLTISPSASGVGGSTKIILRGNRSLQGNNQPLYVIDGIPMLNSGAGGQITNVYGGGDGGDGISNLNPEDIESISILEGASAAALYGSQAQNGVVLVITKKGKTGKAQINFASSYSIDHVTSLPKLQNQFGATNFAAGSYDSWGAPITKQVPDNLKAFFQDGINATNSISIATGSEMAKTFFSYANTHATGVEPTNKLNRNNFDLRETANLLNNKLTIDGSISYINQSINNSPGLGGSSILVPLYNFPRGVNILPYKNEYEIPNVPVAQRENWLPLTTGGNPWWGLYRSPSITTRNRLILSGTVKYEFSKWMNLQVRGNVDRISDNYEQDNYGGPPQSGNPNRTGSMSMYDETNTQKYADAILNLTVPLKHTDFKITALAGGSYTDQYVNGLGAGGILSTPDFFTPANILSAGGGATLAGLIQGGVYAFAPNHTQLQALFGSADISFKNWVYLTVTGRNDWSSNLSFTNNFSYFYPSAGLSVVLSNALRLPEFVSYAKLRGSLAQVGNTIPPYLTNPQNIQTGNGALSLTIVGTPRTLQPEKTNSLELGTDIRFFNNRLTFSFTYYKTNTLNQYFQSSPSAASLVSSTYVNAGNIQNSGIEFTVSYDVLRSRDFTWNTSFNGAMNKSKVLALDPTNQNAPFYLTGNVGGYTSQLVIGGRFGDIYGQSLLRNAKGQLELSGDGTTTSPYALQTNGTYQFLGNPNPKFSLGWSNAFSYKKFSLNFLVDGKFGGKVVSMTQPVLDYLGVSQVTADARNGGGVKVSGVDGTGKLVNTVIDAKTYYQTTGASAAIQSADLGQYAYSATVVRLREASLGYAISIANSFFRSIKLSVIGRNLIYFHKKAPFDPEVTMSTGNGFSGLDLYNPPSTRNLGLSLSVGF
jgi:TonB-linked SusC/RagA family outer membrane protein